MPALTLIVLCGYLRLFRYIVRSGFDTKKMNPEDLDFVLKLRYGRTAFRLKKADAYKPNSPEIIVLWLAGLKAIN